LSRSDATIAWVPPGGRKRQCTFSGLCPVGRASSNRIILDGAGVSREQAVFELTVDRLRIRNLSQACSMTLNGLHGIGPGAEATLHQGDTVQVGAHTLTVTRMALAHQMLRCLNPSCQREVEPHLHDCPWCGRSLAFAQTDVSTD
jgi:hypothetical protein